jgi:hypothetical protein
MHNKARVAPWPSIEIPEFFAALESSDAIGQLLSALNSQDALNALSALNSLHALNSLNALNALNALNGFHTKRDIGNGASKH